jgi:hypothetical protein
MYVRVYLYCTVFRSSEIQFIKQSRMRVLDSRSEQDIGLFETSPDPVKEKDLH